MQRRIAGLLLTLGLAGIGSVGSLLWHSIDPEAGWIIIGVCSLAAFIVAPVLWLTGKPDSDRERPIIHNAGEITKTAQIIVESDGDGQLLCNTRTGKVGGFIRGTFKRRGK